jgi:phage terminase large subunit-like protein
MMQIKKMSAKVFGSLYQQNPIPSEGALWEYKLIDNNRVTICPELVRAVIAIDPATTSNEGSDETGMMRGGMSKDGNIYICEDRSGIYTPREWAAIAIDQYDYNKLDKIVAEVNNGGDMIEGIIRNIDPNVSYASVWASRGKVTRAEPIVALYEQGRVHHVGKLDKLEDEMCQWRLGDKSPNRIDALVWLCTYLLEGTQKKDFFVV